TDDKAVRISDRTSDESHVNSSISHPFDKLVTDPFVQPLRYERKGFPKRANGAGHKRMKRAHRCNSHADLAQLSARGAPGGLECLVEMRQHGAGIVQESAAGVRQLDPARLAAKKLHVKLAFHRLDAEAERGLLHAKPLRGAGDMPLLRNGDEISEVSQLQGHTQIGMNFAVIILSLERERNARTR